MRKHTICSVGAILILYGMGLVFGGPRWAFGITAFVLSGGLFTVCYEKAHPETVPNDTSRHVTLAALERFISLYNPRAIKQSHSLWQMLGRSVLLALLWPMLFALSLMRWLWNERL